jgi:hypothetical protein
MAIVTRLTGAEAFGGTLKELFVDGSKQLVKDKADKDRSQGGTLGEALVSEEEIGGAVRASEVTTVRGTIHEVKIGKEGMEELGVVLKGMVGGVMRDGIEHVDNIKGEQGSVQGEVGGKGTVDILVELSLGGVVKEEINAAVDGNTKLTFFEEESGEAEKRGA